LTNCKKGLSVEFLKWRILEKYCCEGQK